MSRVLADTLNKEILGKTFNNWTVIDISSTDNRKVVCRCSCGTVKELFRQSVVSGKSKSCGCLNKSPVNIGDTFGYWKVLQLKGTKALCQCKLCGNTKELYKSNLIKGTTTSCGCKKYGTELIGKTFGKWKVIGLGNSADKVKCQCECGTIQEVYKRNLINGISTSCGCGKTLKERNIEQIQVVKSANELYNFIKQKFNRKPTLKELSESLGLTYSYTAHIVDMYNLKDEVYFLESESNYEIELREYIDGLGYSVEAHNKSIINPYEIDILVKSENIAFEFDGNYWHSDQFKSRDYHYNKTKMCSHNGIRLVHIFEYEWLNNNEVIKRYIDSLLNKNKETIYARNTTVEVISKQEASEFCNKYHIKGSSISSIELGLKYNNTLIGVMTLGTPRFNTEYQYEIIRLCFDNTKIVVGGTEKLFRYFITKYDVKSIISYCDLAKFTGSVYDRLGMSPIGISAPNYVWCDGNSKVISRYAAQKKKLIEKGLASEDDTENTAMRRLGYSKIYDCGNAVYGWHK